MNREDFNRAVVPLDQVLEDAGWSAHTKETAASPLMLRRLTDQRELRIDRVEAIVDQAMDRGTVFRASDNREATRLRDEVEAIDDVIDEARSIWDNPDRTRREHVKRASELGMYGGGGGFGQSLRRADPLDLTLDDELVKTVRAAARDHQSIRRSLSDARSLVSSSEPSSAARGRLANYATVRESSSPSAAFVPVNLVANAAAVAEGAAKPEIGNASTVSVTHSKLAGYVDVTLEEIVYGADIVQAIQDVAMRGLINAENAAIATVLLGAPNIAASTTPAKSILAGIAAVAAGGGQASVIAVAPADVPVILGESTTLGYTVNSGGGAERLATSLWGVPLVPAVGVPAGTAFVWDTAALGMSVAMPPTLLVDPYSQARNNIVNVVVEELVGFALVASAMAAEVDLVP